MLDDIKALLGFTDDSMDAKLKIIIKVITARIMLRLNKAGAVLGAVPDELSFIVTEVAIARYNQIASEGTVKHSVDGESQEWVNDLLSPYLSEIDDWLTSNGYKSGGIKFI